MLSTSGPPGCVLQVTTRGIRVAELNESVDISKQSPKPQKKGKAKNHQKVTMFFIVFSIVLLK